MSEAASDPASNEQVVQLSAPASAGASVLPFDAIFMAAPLPASVSRWHDGRLLAVNEAWLNITGLSREEAIGRTTIELGHWRDTAHRDRYLRDLPGPDEVQVLHLKGGLAHRVRMHATALETGSDKLLLVYFTETTRELEAEAALVKTNEALKLANVALQQRVELHAAIEKMARVGHWTNAENQDEVIWSLGLYEIAGLQPSDRIGRMEGRSGIHPDDQPAWSAARAAMDGREVEFRWLRPDGRQRWFRTRIGQTMVAGNPQTDFGVVQDITPEREATQGLAEQLNLLQGVAARVPGMMYRARLTPGGKSTVSYVNDAVRDMLEVEPEELLRNARILFDRVHPDDRPTVVASLNAASLDLVLWRQTYRVVLPRRGTRWYSVEAVPQLEPDGSVVWHGFTTDVTEARTAAQRVERQQRMLEAVRGAQAVFIETEDKREAFQGLLDAFLQLTNSGYGFVGEVLYDVNDNPYLKTHAITDISWDAESRRMYTDQLDAGMIFSNLKTLFGHAMTSGQPVIANDPSSDRRAAGMPSGHPPMDAFLGIPLAVGDRLVAMVGLANQPDGYSEADIEFLQPLLGAVRQLVLAWRGFVERTRTRSQLEATSALLAEKSAALQATLDSITQGLTKIDAQGRVLFYNRRVLELLDLPDELLARRPTHEEVVQFQRDRGDFGAQLQLVDPLARRYLGEPDPIHMPDHYWRKMRDGRTLEIRSRALPDGGVVRTFTDVTSYISTQEALREERQRLAWVLDATRPGIWETNLTNSTLTINERWAEMLGYTLQELEPIDYETWRSRVHPDDLVKANVVREKHLSGELPFYDCDLRMRHKDGHWVWINTRGRVHQLDNDERALYMSGTHLDISERVAAQEQIHALNASLEQRVQARTAELERSMRDMEAISYSIAHDLRAPLRSVNGFAQVIAEEEGEGLSENGRQMFERIARSSRNMGQMITDMLELLRVVQVELVAQPVPMASLASTVADALAPQVPNTRIDVGDLPDALGDATLLRQVLSNLLDNALKYSRHQTEPVVSVGFDAEAGAYFVRDNGMGFDMARANKLFGLFQRLHAGTDVPGMGVGLAIVARIIERHNGTIWAESAPGQGACFWFRVPRA
ncbi:PAS domain-containing protein [Hydrogenophaga sp.]|uniref:PAS domain-containing protein n=1 Tax=Hydrogenophaga sp. TaxID=1904254 RepID=UPI0025BF7AEE|nr:PAS domain-containing protein [Hydrogenophaga sp.]MBT9463002.1 PAS domain-containing protein [Hydrogenophaga sp.]